jgi:hypothetical protein
MEERESFDVYRESDLGGRSTLLLGESCTRFVGNLGDGFQ